MLRICMDGGASDLGVCNTLFSPGQCVSGKVHLDLEKDEEVSRVLIEFRGKIRTSITTGTGNNKRTRRHEHIMFSYEKLLFDGKGFKLRATNYEWPFSFTFPGSFDMRNNSFDPSAFFKTGEQALPPSCFDIDDGGRVNGAIKYHLLARVPRIFLDWKFETRLTFTPLRLQAFPHSMHMPIEQREAVHNRKFRLDAIGPRSLTTKESFSDKFHSQTDTKNIRFRVIISAPTVVVIGNSYPLLVTLKSDWQEKVLPDFKLHHIEAHFTASTQIRVGGSFGDHVSETENKIPLLSTKEGLDIALPINSPVTVSGVFPPTNYTPPTFSTVSMWRSYRLSIHLKVRCLDENYKVTCKWLNVMLLPMKMEAGVEETASMITSGQFSASELTPSYGGSSQMDAPPPTYNEAQAS